MASDMSSTPTMVAPASLATSAQLLVMFSAARLPLRSAMVLIWVSSLRTTSTPVVST